jgi:colicin import membrane protein
MFLGGFKLAKEKVKKPFYKKWWVWVIAIVVAIGLAGGGEETKDTTSEPETEAVDTTVEETTTTEETVTEPVEEEPAPAVEEEPETPSMSVSQESAVRKAEAYIDMGGFSKTGLIKQLEFEKFSKKDSAFAVENIDVDWKEQAKIKAEAYMDMQGFSRQGLIEQLKYEGFTDEEANYGADQVGL